MNGFVVRLPKKHGHERSECASLPAKRSKGSCSTGEPSTTNKGSSSDRRSVQMFLDFGQSGFNKHTECACCGLMFVGDDSEDMKQHARFCEKKALPVTLPSLHGYAVVCRVHSDKHAIVKVAPKDLRPHRELLERVVETMETDLGTDRDFVTGGQWMYLYVDDRRRVLSAVVFDIIGAERTTKIKNFDDITKLVACNSSEESNGSDEPILGVRLMWVHRNHRRTGIMSRIIDSARRHFLFGKVFDRSQVAFSQPTEEGFRFALKYGGNDHALCFSCPK